MKLDEILEFDRSLSYFDIRYYLEGAENELYLYHLYLSYLDVWTRLNLLCKFKNVSVGLTQNV